jgi:hypothetical protein
MRQQWILAVAAAAAVGAAAPAEASAQGASQSARAGQPVRPQQQARPQQARTEQQRERARAAEQRQREQARAAEQRQRDAERARRAERDRYEQRDGRYDDRLGQQQRNGQGPPFCRDGSGHPVHGRQWCRDKGWGLGVQWDRARWEDVVLRQPRDRNHQLNRGGLIDVLGDVVFGRLETQGRRHGRGSLAGTWLQDGNAGVLQLSVGGIPFARLVDSNRDGRVDAVLLRR